jgi:VanZ family protein
MLRYLLYPFLVYRSVLHPTLILSLVAVPCWLAFRLYRLRTSGQRMSAGHELLLLAFVVYLCGLGAATLDPNDRARMRTPAMPALVLRPRLTTLTCSSPKLRASSTARFFCMYNARGNVLLFFPLGVLISLIWRRLRFWQVVLIGSAVSVGIETLQYVSSAWGSYRLADVNDVILNTLGASIGVVVVLGLRMLARRPSAFTASRATAG